MDLFVFWATLIISLFNLEEYLVWWSNPGRWNLLRSYSFFADAYHLIGNVKCYSSEK
jgi:hypothetical protein